MPDETATGAEGVRFHVEVTGRPDATTILFVHGWSQCSLCWSRQLQGPLAERYRLAAFDLRGHGRSEAPANRAAYSDPGLWADDLAAVIDHLGPNPPLLVGWSLGGNVVSDYLTVHGDGAIAGINLVSVPVRADPSVGGPGWMANYEGAIGEDLPRAIESMRRLVRAFASTPLEEGELETMLCFSMIVPAWIRSACLERGFDSSPAWKRSTVPLLITHGAEDSVCLPAAAEYTAGLRPDARLSIYEAAGHLCFVEQQARFDRELAEFAQQVWDRV
jgi:pimeloyl-ACP methyl ester carboxylesterase